MTDFKYSTINFSDCKNELSLPFLRMLSEVKVWLPYTLLVFRRIPPFMSKRGFQELPNIVMHLTLFFAFLFFDS